MGHGICKRASTALAVMLMGAAVLAADKPASKKSKASKSQQAADDSQLTNNPKQESEKPLKTEEATFGSGCFWCAEAVFQQLKGVKSVVSGYSGGSLKNPTYEQVSTDLTGHAEVVNISFDPEVISYDELLEVFWKSHDPTKLNEQGPDHGTRYRSVIFYHSDEQKELAEKSKEKHMKSGRGGHRIVTEITKFTAFYPAEDYHQNYFRNNPREAYCQFNVRPKVNKVKKEFKDLLKDSPTKK
jgi:peptide-methionine (S)-S-oxide reductase